jgi:hypothetical protein
MGTALKIIAVLAGLGMVFEGVKTFRSGMVDSGASSQNQTHSSTASSTPAPASAVAAPLQFAIFDKLGTGLISETVWVYLDEHIEQAATMTLTPQEPRGEVVVHLPVAGHHALRIKTESVLNDPKNGRKSVISFGRWETDLRGGEKFDLTATPQDNSDSYQLQVTVRDEK